MPQRLAAVMALIAFAMCLVSGGLQADNPFTTTVIRALVAMSGTYVVGLVIGLMTKKMLDENLHLEQKKLSDLETKPPAASR